MSLFDEPTIVKGPVDLVATVPYLLGFDPRDCVVCVAVHDGAVAVAAHLRLPGPAEDDSPDWTAVADLIAARGHQAFIVGYGTADQIDAAVEQCAEPIAAAGVEVTAAMRVHDGRIYCLGSSCGCPPDGIAYDPDTSTVPAQATVRGIAPLADRDAVDALLDPVTGPDRDRMAAATTAAMHRLARALSAGRPATAGLNVTAWLATGPPPDLVADGIAAVREAFAAAAAGQTLLDEQVAWLATVLLIPAVREHAWLASDGSDAHRTLWIDVTRRAVGRTAATPASLLAVTAYLAGDGALASAGVDRALTAEPTLQLARLVGVALRAGIPPAVWRQAMTGHS